MFFREHKRVFHRASEGPGRTKQAFKAECDINTIMKRYEKTGIVDHVARFGGRYGDYLGAVDYHTAMNEVTKAQEMFLSLPARVRARFGNDPGQFVEFALNPENLDELRELGLAPPREREEAPPAPAPDSSELSMDELRRMAKAVDARIVAMEAAETA